MITYNVVKKPMLKP